jgi:hypothetical protein
MTERSKLTTFDALQPSAGVPLAQNGVQGQNEGWVSGRLTSHNMPRRNGGWPWLTSEAGLRGRARTTYTVLRTIELHERASSDGVGLLTLGSQSYVKQGMLCALAALDAHLTILVDIVGLC